MGAAEEQRDEMPLTPEELKELREYLPLLRALRRLTVGAATIAAKPLVNRKAEPRPEDFELVRKRNKRRG